MWTMMSVIYSMIFLTTDLLNLKCLTTIKRRKFQGDTGNPHLHENEPLETEHWVMPTQALLFKDGLRGWLLHIMYAQCWAFDLHITPAGTNLHTAGIPWTTGSKQMTRDKVLGLSWAAGSLGVKLSHEQWLSNFQDYIQAPGLVELSAKLGTVPC